MTNFSRSDLLHNNPLNDKNIRLKGASREHILSPRSKTSTLTFKEAHQIIQITIFCIVITKKPIKTPINGSRPIFNRPSHRVISDFVLRI